MAAGAPELLAGYPQAPQSAQTPVRVPLLAVCHRAGYFWDWISANWSQFFGESLAGWGRKRHLLAGAGSRLLNALSFSCSATVLQVQPRRVPTQTLLGQSHAHLPRCGLAAPGLPLLRPQNLQSRLRWSYGRHFCELPFTAGSREVRWGMGEVLSGGWEPCRAHPGQASFHHPRRVPGCCQSLIPCSITFRKSQRRASSSCTPALTTPPEWIPGRSSGRRWQPR